MKKALFILSTALIVLSSCNKNLIEDRNEDGGYILFQVASNDAMSTKATVDPSALENYTVTIKKNSESGEQVVSKTLSEFGDKLCPVATGTYYVAMENITASAAVNGKGAKRIAGHCSVDVTAGHTVTASIAGEVVNAATKIVFDESFTNVFKDYTVTLDPDGVRNISTSTNNDEIFWNPGTVSFNISAKLKSDHTQVNGSGSVKLSEKDYKTLTFKAGQNGKILLSITADDGMTNGTVNITVDPNTGSVSNQ